MTIKSTIEDMPGEKQVAWALRLLITIVMTVVGTISWSAFQKLDRIAEVQSAQTVQLNRLVTDDMTRRERMDALHDMYYRLADQLRALDQRLGNQERRADPPRKTDDQGE